MTGFGIPISGDLTVRGVSPDEAVDRLQAALTKAHASDTARSGTELRFKGARKKLANFEQPELMMLTSGHVAVSCSPDGVRIKYRVVPKGILSVGAAGVLGGVQMYRAGASSIDAVLNVTMGGLIVVTMVYVLHWSQFRAFVRRAVRARADV